MKQPIRIRTLSLVATAAFVAACSGGGNGVSSSAPGSGFAVVRTEPLNNGRLFLNEPIRVDFNTPVDLTSADLNSFSFTVLDQNGTPVAEQPAGEFLVDKSPGDTVVGRRLLFQPRYPTNDTFDDGGFRPGRTYIVQLVAGNRHNGTSLRDTSGNVLAAATSFRFSTADGNTPAQLFRDFVPGGPRKLTSVLTASGLQQFAGYIITPALVNGRVGLNKFGAPPVEIRLFFDQPLNPQSSNVPVALDNNPLLRSINDRGRIFLEYDDSDPAGRGSNVWIPADFDVEQNGLVELQLPGSSETIRYTGCKVVLRPVGVLPNNATVRVIVENTLEDISGESNVANAAYDRGFTSFLTAQAFNPQFDAVVTSFDNAAQIDLTAPFLEPFAEIDQGFLRAGFGFEGTPTVIDYNPNNATQILNTDFTQVIPANGPPFSVSGGVFNFRNVTIRAGVFVQGLGTNPMVWLVNGNFNIDGQLSVDGGQGERVNTLNSANFPAGGGPGVCGGGRGGDGSPSGTQRDLTGQSGFGPRQRPGGGGGPGRMACTTGCSRGSGGGGGSMATQGDPWYHAPATSGTSFQQRVGRGGQGCDGASGATTRSLQGGDPGPLAFSDARSDNNFWGAGVNVATQIRIVGELANPVGGEGGGGGGDLTGTPGSCTVNDPNYASDMKGGGGGGGAGVLIIKALGDITIGSTGRIHADGGNGGGGEQAGTCNEGGGGGGGSGGMVILMAGGHIRLNAHGVSTPTARWRYGENDYDFCVSADGGVTLTGSFGTPDVESKYPASGQTMMTGASYDSAPLGGLGGLGVVQLMAPPGPSSDLPPDGTNTLLDDNIDVFVNGVRASGTTNPTKQALLAWRGFPYFDGRLTGDDPTTTINIGDNEGDIRPTPIFLPVTFSSRTRLRSKWIDTGASSRIPQLAPTSDPRIIVEDPTNNLRAGPTYSFAGTFGASADPFELGYARFEQSSTSSVRLVYPVVLQPTDVFAIAVNSDGSYRIDLATPALQGVADRFSQYEAELLNVNNLLLGSYRILSHSDRQLVLSSESGLLPPATDVRRVRILAKFFKIVTDGSEGLGRTNPLVTSNAVPISNVRIGFAFHKDPSIHPAPGTNIDPNRFPTQVGTFVFDISDPTVQETIRSTHMPFVTWDVLFNTGFKSTASDIPQGLSPASPRPELHFLRIPFRF